MIIATFALGDHVTTLVKRNKLTSDDINTYILTNVDTATDETYTKSFTGENDAVRAFCACIASDEPDLSVVLQDLRSDPAMKPFLA